MVDEVVDEHADLLVRAAGFFRRLRVEGLLAGRRLGDGDEDLGRRDEVDLLVVEAILGRDCDRHEEDADHVVVVCVDLGPRFVLVHVRGEQRLQRSRVDVLRQRAVQLDGGRVDQVEPLRALGHSPRLRTRPDD